MVRTIGEDKAEKTVIAHVAEFGWHCVNILPEGEHVQYSFTVGLHHSYNFPELVIFGLKSEVAHQILTIAADAAKANAPLDLTKPTEAFVEGYPTYFCKVQKTKYHEFVGFCQWYYNGNNFPLYQIVWPSKTGFLPWQSGASPEFKAAQPFIGIKPNGT